MPGFDPSKVKLRKTSDDPDRARKETTTSVSPQIDFRAGLKKTSKLSDTEKKGSDNPSHLVNFRGLLKTSSNQNNNESTSTDSLPKLDATDSNEEIPGETRSTELISMKQPLPDASADLSTDNVEEQEQQPGSSDIPEGWSLYPI
ncbi:hypothetical protein RFI_33525, partial [Reticulomyxa filosa]